MRKKIFHSLVLVSLMVLVLSSVISTAFLYSYFNSEQAQRLTSELNLAAKGVNEIGVDYLDGVGWDQYRFTVISQDGTVLYDTNADAAQMDNHSDREEVKEALKYGHGSSARYSSTLTQKTFYEAVKLDNNDVLRVSVNQLTAGGAFFRVLPMNLIITAIAVTVSLFVSNRMSKRITAPLENLDLDNPTENNIYEELSPMLTKIHRQHKEISRNLEEMRRKNEEFSQIISSMSEGLVLLNQKGAVIAMNSAAETVFSVDQQPVGRDFLTLERSTEISHAIQQAETRGHSQTVLTKNGKIYQFNISRIEAEKKAVGTLILAFDITEKANAEQNRREFTANVSHELKTPLQSVIGSAELLENGLVRDEDIPRFVGNIKTEATRLLSLINDIIRLSQLDEKADEMKEPVDLSAVAREAAEVLSDAAASRNITIALDADNITIPGVRRYIYEIIYNLCDNAVRYNKDGGRVEVSIKKEGENAVITVRDTGIGIPAEDTEKVFERFYRVDKSHSRKTGGTGLGLSIVKRAVMLHGGRIELKSEVGKGTEIKVYLPK